MNKTKGTKRTVFKKAKIIAVDLDGTLAKELHPYDPTVIGPPITKSIARYKKMLKQGIKLVIYTSRVHSSHTPWVLKSSRKLISAWCLKYLGKRLPITAEKSPLFIEIHDNRARQVETNTGRIIGD